MKAIPSGHTQACSILTLAMKAATRITILFLASMASPTGFANTSRILASEMQTRDQFQTFFSFIISLFVCIRKKSLNYSQPFFQQRICFFLNHRRQSQNQVSLLGMKLEKTSLIRVVSLNKKYVCFFKTLERSLSDSGIQDL